VSGESRKQLSAGFTYIGLLIAIAILGVMLSATAGLWSVSARRDREKQLLSIGHEFREAIGHYYASPHDGANRYPRSLEDLVEDQNGVATRHHLRRIYRDPMTATADWGIVRAPDGGITGVYSTSPVRPLKRANFEAADRAFETAACYCDWKFVYEPARRHSPRQRQHRKP
jgi:type II secretory pathway pseudopilin PulG